MRYNFRYCYDWDGVGIICGFGFFTNGEEAMSFWNALDDNTKDWVESCEHDFIHILEEDDQYKDLFIGFELKPELSAQDLNKEVFDFCQNFKPTFDFYFQHLYKEIEPKFCVLVYSY